MSSQVSSDVAPSAAGHTLHRERAIERIHAPARRARILASVGVGLVAAMLALWLRASGRSNFSDAEQLWLAARALVEGRHPYDALAGTSWRALVYPMPAVLVAVPLSALSRVALHCAVAGLGMAAATYALSRRSWWPCLCLLSWPGFDAIQLAQWSPVFVGAAAIPALGWLAIAKPTTGGAAVLAYGRLDTSRANRINVAIALGLIVISFALVPDWVTRWRAAVASMHHFAPLVTRPGGALLLLAAFRWRRPEARLLVALAIVPQTAAPYEALLLALVIERKWEAIAFSTLSVCILPWLLQSAATDPAFDAVVGRNALVLLIGLYLPCLIMVLRRPNVASAPQ